MGLSEPEVGQKWVGSGSEVECEGSTIAGRFIKFHNSNKAIDQRTLKYITRSGLPRNFDP